MKSVLYYKTDFLFLVIGSLVANSVITNHPGDRKHPFVAKCNGSFRPLSLAITYLLANSPKDVVSP